jgi:ectoine hydroxylase-related dioxygenase (phytanoyl-CoA dioxygenase family)
MNAQDQVPSPADVEFYDEHGWWISRKVFSDEQIDDALDAARRYHEGVRDAELPAPIKRYLSWTPVAADERLTKDDYVVLQSEVLGQIGLAACIGETAARLARTDEIRHFGSSLIYKSPLVRTDAARVGWHVDRAYWQTCSSENMLTAWVPLHDCDATMGTITMIDRSHRWPSGPAVDALRVGTTFISDDVASIERRLSTLGLAVEMVPMSLEKGQVSYHSCLTFHGSDINRSSTPRVCLTIHLQDEHNTYREARKPNGEPVVHNTDLLVRRLASGQPDYRDPRVCPVIWRAGARQQAGLLTAGS